MRKNIIFINQYGRVYAGKKDVYNRHVAVLDRTKGHVGLMPVASYTIEKIQFPAPNMAVASVTWKYPPYAGMPKRFDPHNPMQGVFGFSFVKDQGLWSIAMAQNTPSIPKELNAKKSSSKAT